MILDYEMERLSPEIKSFVASWHYLKNVPNSSSYIFVARDENKFIKAVACFGQITRLQAKNKYKNCIELQRFVCHDDAPKNTESCFLSYCLKQFANTKYMGVVSYADSTQGHEGTIYKASNWKKIGESAQSYHYVDTEGKYIHKKTVWNYAKNQNLTEAEYVNEWNLTKIVENKKHVFFYDLVPGYWDKMVSMNFNFDKVSKKKVFYHKISKKWQAEVKTANSKNYIDYFDSEEEAWIACERFEEEFMSSKLKRSSYAIEVPISGLSLPHDFDKERHCCIVIGSRHYYIDRCDLDFCLKRKWNVFSVYMTISNRFSKEERIFHRNIMSAKDGYVVDHINGMKNDNRRCNLRIVIPSANNQNRHDKQEVKGVRYRKNGYEVEIKWKRKSIYIGRFQDKEEAMRAYDRKAVEYYGHGAYTNFPITDYEIPEHPLASFEKVNTFKLTSFKKCGYDGCVRLVRSKHNDHCQRCLRKIDRREIAAFEGREVKKYKERVAKASEFCQIENCKNPVSARNLCATHYYHERKKEDPSYRADKPKKIYACTYAGCEAQYQHKENLCLVHYNEKHGIIPGPRTGRPSNGKVDCKQCGAVGVATQPSCLCSKCYRRNYMAAKRSADKDYGKKKSEP